MSWWSCYKSLAVLWLLSVDEGSQADEPSLCREGEFFYIKEGACKKCSTSCPKDLISYPCSDFQDVRCESFPRSREPYSSKPFQGHRNGASFDGYINRKIGVSRESAAIRRKDQTSENELETTIEKHDWKYWKTLAFALIALLSVLIIVATIVVVVACLKVQQALITKQQEEADIDDADSGYVVIRTIRDVSGSPADSSDHKLYTPEELSAHPPLLALHSQDTDQRGSSEGPSFSSSPPQSLCFLPRTYTPQRRLLTYDADEVFESDDQLQHPSVRVQNDRSGQAASGSGGYLDSNSIHSIPDAVNDTNIPPSSHCQRQKKNWCRKKRKDQNVSGNIKVANTGCFGR
ncbi:rho guanine nucleotide exchange factor [Plakobranchus ocellatus]|uniref:Rho guanine nucleotide exchange factor n=1 Tax=Plakobranchus ocellatus TaxID=259542 RepID=A0AAV3YZX7_9GAST|nr:rho guanine nucleotide exchange factor [Plakobranchus ocellatus]